MEKIKKEDLQYKYKWNSIADDNFCISPDQAIDRNCGMQMLQYFNHFLRCHGLFSLSSINRLEELVYNYLPEEIDTVKEINTWVGQNWNGNFTTQHYSHLRKNPAEKGRVLQ